MGYIPGLQQIGEDVASDHDLNLQPVWDIYITLVTEFSTLGV